jgi:transcriptional regulator with XRE-family HTH domain
MFQSPAIKISAYLEENGIKQSFLSKKTGIKPQTLSAKLNGIYKFTPEEIEIICGVLGKEPNDFLEARIPESVSQ